MKKLNSIKHIFISSLILCLGVSVSHTSYAFKPNTLETVVVKNNGKYNVHYSKHDITRISVMNDRIKSIIKGDAPFQIEPDPDKGDMFLKIEEGRASNKIYNIFVRTESGLTYQLHLLPYYKQGSQVMLINPTQDRAKKLDNADDFERSSPYQNTILKIIRALYLNQTIDGYTMHSDYVAGNKNHAGHYRVVKKADQGSVYRTFTYKGKNFMGETFRCSNVKAHLHPQDFYDENVMAVWNVPFDEMNGDTCLYRVSRVK